MKRGIILVLMFILFSSMVFADNINLGVTVENNQVTFSWNNIFYEEPEPFCGDGNLDEGEECDDGNEDMGDGCSIICELECGDGFKEEWEECDDENRDDGDGCSSECKIEVVEGKGLDDVTTEAVRDNEGFFSKIFSSIANVFKKIFGGGDVGSNVSGGSYTLYKSVEGEIEEIIDGLVGDFSCEETCSHSFSEEDGDYTYYIIASNSDKSNEVEKTIGEGDIPGDGNIPECGNGEIEGEEECDDGNLVDGDECSSVCLIEEEIICENNGDCSDGFNCEDGVCVVITNNDPECSDENPCDEGFNCEEGVCVEIIVDETCEVGAEDVQECEPFDVGICQKSQTKTRTCDEEGAWGEFRGCSIAEDQKCTETENNCESEICDTDSNSCMPAEFEWGDDGEGEETTCDDNLDNDCDGDEDCEDGDCSYFPGCEDNDNLDDECEESLDCEEGRICRSGNCIILGGFGCEFDGDCEINEICEFGECIPDESYFEDGSSFRQGEGGSDSSRDVTGRLQEDDYGENYYEDEEREGLSLLTWIIIEGIILIVGIVGIWFFIFKFRKKPKLK